jgi:ketosteroid isomerase-like protein
MTDDLLRNIYDSFNRRDIDALLAKMAPDVDWPNGMEGGRVHGREAVRQYWMRQWGMIDPRVEPQRFETDPAGRIVVHVRQTVRDLSGALVSQKMVRHTYSIQNGLIRTMEIQND